MNVEIGTEAAQFPEKEFINGIFVAVHADSCYAGQWLLYVVKILQWFGKEMLL
jgi:hypothetical protein